MATTTQTPFPTSSSSESGGTGGPGGSVGSTGGSGTSLGGSSSSPLSSSSSIGSGGSASSLGEGSSSLGGRSSSMGGSSSSMGGGSSSMGGGSSAGNGYGADSMSRSERMDRVVQGAHDAVDRLAAKAAPLVERFGSSVDGASGQMHDRADQLVAMQEEWIETARATVREHPIASLATAVAVGMILSRLSR